MDWVIQDRARRLKVEDQIVNDTVGEARVENAVGALRSALAECDVVYGQAGAAIVRAQAASQGDGFEVTEYRLLGSARERCETLDAVVALLRADGCLPDVWAPSAEMVPINDTAGVGAHQ